MTTIEPLLPWMCWRPASARLSEAHNERNVSMFSTPGSTNSVWTNKPTVGIGTCVATEVCRTPVLVWDSSARSNMSREWQIFATSYRFPDTPATRSIDRPKGSDRRGAKAGVRAKHYASGMVRGGDGSLAITAFISTCVVARRNRQ